MSQKKKPLQKYIFIQKWKEWTKNGLPFLRQTSYRLMEKFI